MQANLLLTKLMLAATALDANASPMERLVVAIASVVLVIAILGAATAKLLLRKKLNVAIANAVIASVLANASQAVHAKDHLLMCAATVIAVNAQTN